MKKYTLSPWYNLFRKDGTLIGTIRPAYEGSKWAKYEANRVYPDEKISHITRDWDREKREYLKNAK